MPSEVTLILKLPLLLMPASMEDLFFTFSTDPVAAGINLVRSPLQHCTCTLLCNEKNESLNASVQKNRYRAIIYFYWSILTPRVTVRVYMYLLVIYIATSLGTRYI